MTFTLALMSLIVATLLPGYCLLPRSIPRRHQLAWLLFASLSVTSILGLLLLLSGHFSIFTIAALEIFLLAVPLVRHHWPRVDLRSVAVPLLMTLPVIVYALLTAGEPFDADADAGVYTLAGLHLEQSGQWTWQLSELLEPGIPIDLVTHEPRLSQTWRQISPGFVVDHGTVTPQFLPLFPLWAALFSAVFGWQGILICNLWSLLLLAVACDGLWSFYLPKRPRRLALTLLLLNPLLLVFVKYPSAETFLAAVLTGWLLWMTRYLRRPGWQTVVLPSALLGLAVTIKFFAWAVVGVSLLVAVLLPLKKCWPLLVTGFAVALAAALDLSLASPHLSNHAAQLRIVSGFKLAVVAGAILIVLAALRAITRPLTSTSKVLALLYPAAILTLWLGGKLGQIGPPSHVDHLGILLGHGFVAASAAGLTIHLWRRPDTSWRLLPCLLFSFLTLFLLLGSGDSPFYPFAARRYLPLTVPLGCLYLVLFLRWLSKRTSSRRTATALLVVLALALAVPPLWSQRSALTTAQGRGFIRTLRQLASVLPEDTPVLATGRAWRYAPYLLLLEGRPVYCADLRRPDLLLPMHRLFEERPDTLVLTDRRLSSPMLAEIKAERSLIAVRRTPPLLAESPSAITYRLVAPAPHPPPLVIDVGSHDLSLVSNVHPAEIQGQRSFRWTKPRAKVLVHPGSRVRFTWSRGGNPNHPLPVRVLANGTDLGLGVLRGGWQTSRWFDLPPSAEAIELDFKCATFRPVDLGRSGDVRRLGFRLDEVEVEVR